MADATIPTNPGTGGPSLDAETAYQADGATVGYRERVQVAFAAEDPRGRIVSQDMPLPVDSMDANRLLTQMAEDIREIKILLALAIGA